MAKRSATDHALKQLRLAMRIYGAMGVTEEVGLEQLWYDVRALQLAGGTMGVLALIQGR